ncbi:MAG TPA: hypothetical protein VH590_16560, partial [Ktedonobacterales bacterium]
QLRPADFIHQVLPDAEYQGPLETDMATEPQLVLDTLYGIRYHGIDCAIDFEVQATYDKDMPQRLFEYGSSAMRVHKRPVISVVLWLQSGGTVPEPPYVIQVDNIPIGTWHFHNIRMQNLSASAMITSGPLGLLPFVPFMQGNDEQLAEQAMRRVKAQAPEEEAETLAFVLAVFIAQVYKSDALAWAIARRVFMSTDLFRDSSLIQSILREERLQTTRELAQAALEGRFQTLSDDVIQALGTADEATLKAIVAHVSSDTLEQVRARLGLEPSA